MPGEQMDMEELAAYLHRDKRDLMRLASRGYLPGRKVSGEWRFSRAEINHWLETQLPEYSEEQLSALESRKSPGQSAGLLITSMLSEHSVEVPLSATTRASVLKRLVELAEQSLHVYDADAILTAIRQREDLESTGLDTGVALPHPKRPLAAALGESVIAYGRAASGIPFGAPSGVLSDIFFLVCCRDENSHLAVLARLARLLLRPTFLGDLRAAETATESRQTIEAAERELSE
jgi:PTS system nitrogen regulatory IIA component